uniref:Uncharacterized protein n=1 Tax=Oryza glumipatula TaxID=40148 RepID=A0A0E0BLM2_9ORYZ
MAPEAAVPPAGEDLTIRVVSRRLVKASDATIHPHVATVSNLDLYFNNYQACAWSASNPTTSPWPPSSPPSRLASRRCSTTSTLSLAGSSSTLSPASRSRSCTATTRARSSSSARTTPRWAAWISLRRIMLPYPNVNRWFHTPTAEGNNN